MDKDRIRIDPIRIEMTTFKRLFLLQGWLIIAGLSFLGCAGESADVGNGTEDSSPSGRYLVEGTIQGAAGLPIYLQRLDFSQINRPVVRSIDTVQADAQGRFRFSGSVREPLIGQIQVARDTFFIPLALRDRNIQIEAQRRDMGSIRIEGDPTSAQLAVLMLRLRRENEERGALLMERQRAQRSGDRQSLDATTAAYMQMITDQVDALKAYIDTVSDPVLAIFALESLSFREQFDFIAEFSEKLTGSHPEMRYTRELAAKVDGYERELRATQGNQMVGMQAPDITQPGSGRCGAASFRSARQGGPRRFLGSLVRSLSQRESECGPRLEEIQGRGLRGFLGFARFRAREMVGRHRERRPGMEKSRE